MKSRVSGFSRAKLEAGRNGLGSCIARDGSKGCYCVFQGLARLSRPVRTRFVRGSREISPVPSLHRASTDALLRSGHHMYSTNS